MMKKHCWNWQGHWKEERTSAGESCIVRDCTAKNLHQRSEKLQHWQENGLTGTLEGHRLLGGSMKYISSQVTVGKQVKNQAQILAKQGKTPLLFAKDDVLIGMIAVADVIKEDSPKAVQNRRIWVSGSLC